MWRGVSTKLPCRSAHRKSYVCLFSWIRLCCFFLSSLFTISLSLWVELKCWLCRRVYHWLRLRWSPISQIIGFLDTLCGRKSLDLKVKNKEKYVQACPTRIVSIPPGKCCFPLAEGRNKRKTYFSQGLGAWVLVCGVVRGTKCWVCSFSCCHRCDLTFMHFASFLSAFIALRCTSQCRRMPIIRGQGPALFDGSSVWELVFVGLSHPYRVHTSRELVFVGRKAHGVE